MLINRGTNALVSPGRAALVVLWTTLGASARGDTGDNLFRLGADHYSKARWNLAADEFRELVERFPQHSRAEEGSFFLGESLVQQRHYAAAREVFQRYAHQYPHGKYVPQALFRLGEIAYLNHDDLEAETRLIEYRSRFPRQSQSSLAAAYLGRLQLRQNRPGEAYEFFRLAVDEPQAPPWNDQARLGLVECLVRLGRAGEALPLAAALTPSKNARTATEAYYWLGVCQAEGGQFETAHESLLKAMALLGDRTDALRWGVEIQLAHVLSAGGRPADAMRVLSRLRSQPLPSPWDEACHWGLLDVALKAADHDQVDRLAAEYEQAFGQSPRRGAVRRLWGQSLLARGEAQRALGVLASAHAGDTEAAYLRGVALDRLGQWEEALREFSAAESAGGDLALRARLARGLVLLRQDKNAEAVALLEQASSTVSDADDRDRCYRGLLQGYLRLQRTDAALAAHARWGTPHDVAAQSRPGAAMTLALAEALLRQGQIESAEPLFIAVRESAQGDYVPRGHYGEARCLLARDEPVEAARRLEQFVTSFGDHALVPDALFAQATAMEQAGLPDRAALLYRRVYDDHRTAPLAAPALLAAAKLAGLGKDFVLARELYERLSREHGATDTLEAGLYEWAWLERDSGESSHAQRLFQRIHDEHRGGKYWPDATLRLAEAALARKDHATLRKLAAELLANTESRHPLRQHALFIEAQSYAATEEWEAVTASVDRLRAEFPDGELRPHAEFWRGESLFRRDQHQEALEQFGALEAGGKLGNQAWGLLVPLRRAQSLAHLQRWQEAQEAAERLRRDHPGWEKVYEVDYVLGRCHAARAEFESAREAYRRVVESPSGGRTETAAMAQWMIGETYYHQREYASAIREYLRTRILYPYPRWQAAALLQAAKCHEELGQPAEAARLYSELLDEFPDCDFRNEASVRREALSRQSARVATRGD